MVAPEQACHNLQRLAAEGFIGNFGFFEAIDYTPARQRRGQSSARGALLHGASPGHEPAGAGLPAPGSPDAAAVRVGSAVPGGHAAAPGAHPESQRAVFAHRQLSDARALSIAAAVPIRVFSSPDTPTPEVQLLSNGRYHVMVSNAGGGYSRWKDLAVTRWREDGTCDHWGSFCYVRELAGGANECWSTGHQPTRKRPETYEAIFSEGRAEFRRRDAVRSGSGAIETYTEIVVSPEDDIECAGSGSPIDRGNAGRSRSPVTPKWCSHRRRRTRCIRPSATSSCRPRSCASGARSCARVGRARATSSRPGCCT
jgi:cyclic beta-1,2-glucan synthetase